MADSGIATPGYLYTVLDVDDNLQLGDFEELTGGEMKIDMVNYNLVFENGGSTTRFMPGQTSFSPVKLMTSLSSSCQDTYENFLIISSGVVKRKNFTVTMFNQLNEILVTWDLIDALITDIGGFQFNKGYLVQFEATFQPENIIMEFIK